MSTLREGLDGGGTCCTEVAIFDGSPDTSNPRTDIEAAVSIAGRFERLSLSPDDLVEMTQKEVEALIALDQAFDGLDASGADSILMDSIGYGKFLTGGFVRSQVWNQVYGREKTPFIHQRGAGEDNSWILSTADV